MSFLEKYAQFSLASTILSSLCAVLSSCGDEIDKRSSRPYLSSDAQVEQKLTIQMPKLDDLTEPQQLVALIDYQYIQIKSEGSNCNQELDEVFQAPFQEAQKISLKADYRCDYDVKILIGQENKALALNNEAGRIYFDRDIWPIVESTCISCHPDFINQVSDEQITFQVINKLMPPEAPLGKDEIAKFIAWQFFDYPKTAPDSTDPQAIDRGFSKIFYRSAESVKIKSYEFLSKNQVELETSLWLQQDGKDVGFSTLEWSIQKTSQK